LFGVVTHQFVGLDGVKLHPFCLSATASR
jgi:hypothetical protein